jgi:soluble lytic murein transglycosylase
MPDPLNLQRLHLSKSFFPFHITGAVTFALLVISACGDGSTPSATTPPSDSPTESGQPEDLELAARLYDEGAVEEATAIYGRATRRGPEDQRRQALWALARINYQQGENKAAEGSLQAFLKEQLTPDETRLALLLDGMANYAQGDDGQAEQALNSYLEAGGAAAPYAQLRLAELAARGNHLDQAIQRVSAALFQPLPASISSNARLSLAGYYKGSGDLMSALNEYELLGSSAATQTSRGEALWLAANLALDAGDPARALKSVQTLLAGYPWHDRAAEALDDPRFAPNIGIGSRAIVLFTNRLNADAEAAYRAILDSGDPTVAADAQYHLGVLAERASDYEGALAYYDASINAAAAAQQAQMLGQALWDKSTVLELLGRIDDAVQTFMSIADVTPGSEHASEALFRAGMLRYKQAQPADARAIWSRQRNLASGEEEQARAYFWAAKVASALGDVASAGQDMAAAAALPGSDYYTLRARAELAPGEYETGEEAPAAAPDWATIEAWLTSTSGPEDELARTAFFTSPAFNRAVELLRAGLRTDAEGEFEQLLEDAAGSHWLLYRLARAAGDEGLRSIAARAAARFVTPTDGTPPQVLALAYPSVYPELVNKQASDHKFSPFLLLALIKQESYYDARAVSPANASGLTQVIPETAAGIAEALGEKDFHNSDLLRPRVSLRFGGYYLGTQLELLDGDVPAALAAYNGGPGNAIRWKEATANSDPDVFLESIDFSETKAYVELVLENYAVYLYAYGLTSQPLLPLG